MKVINEHRSLSNWNKEACRKFRVSTGLKPGTSVILMWCFTNWAMKAHIVSVVSCEFIFCHEKYWSQLKLCIYLSSSAISYAAMNLGRDMPISASLVANTIASSLSVGGFFLLKKYTYKVIVKMELTNWILTWTV